MSAITVTQTLHCLFGITLFLSLLSYTYPRSQATELALRAALGFHRRHLHLYPSPSSRIAACLCQRFSMTIPALFSSYGGALQASCNIKQIISCARVMAERLCELWFIPIERVGTGICCICYTRAACGANRYHICLQSSKDHGNCRRSRGLEVRDLTFHMSFTL